MIQFKDITNQISGKTSFSSIDIWSSEQVVLVWIWCASKFDAL